MQNQQTNSPGASRKISSPTKFHEVIYLSRHLVDGATGNDTAAIFEKSTNYWKKNFLVIKYRKTSKCCLFLGSVPARALIRGSSEMSDFSFWSCLEVFTIQMCFNIADDFGYLYNSHVRKLIGMGVSLAINNFCNFFYIFTGTIHCILMKETLSWRCLIYFLENRTIES